MYYKVYSLNRQAFYYCDLKNKKWSKWLDNKSYTIEYEKWYIMRKHQNLSENESIQRLVTLGLHFEHLGNSLEEVKHKYPELFI